MPASPIPWLTVVEVAERVFRGPGAELRREWPAIRCLACRLLAAYIPLQLILLAVAELAARTIHPHTSPLEIEMALTLHRHVVPALTALFLALTILGSGLPTALLTLGFGWALARRRLPLLGAGLALTVTGAWWLETMTKLIVQRSRPELFRLASASGYSFPSGHALVATCLYGALAFAFWRLARRRWQRIALAVIAVLMPALIGVSRIYLGVHYPTDVLGGWLAGLLWLAAARLALGGCARRPA